MQKVLIIGLGGSGGKTLGYLMDELKVHLDESWGKRLPACWEFINIDVPATDGVVGGKLTAGVSELGGTYVGLAGTAGTYSTYDHVMMGNLENSRALGSAARWRPDPIAGSAVPVASGAGAFRAIGRVITVANSKIISDAISAAATRLSSNEAKQDLVKLSGSVGPEDKVFVFLVSSLAGGSGASMVLDVADIVRGLGVSASNLDGAHSTAFLYTADVFSSLGISSGGPGSLATISELAGAMSRSADPWSAADWAKLGSGTAIPTEAGRGPFRIIPVGAKTGSMSFGSTPEDVYRGFARVLAPLFNDSHIQDNFIQHFITNSVAEIARTPDRTKLTIQPNTDDDVLPGHFAGMGSAKLTMGRDRYIEYSAQAIAREAVEVLINGHVNDGLRNKTITLAQAIAAGVEDVYTQFKSISQLPFLDSAPADIARSLSLAVLPESARKDFASSRAQEIRGLVLGVKLSGDTAAGKLDRYLAGNIELLRRSAHEAGLRSISDWARTTVKNIEDAYVYAVSLRGVRVANDALKRLSAELQNASVALSGSLATAPAAFEDKWRIDTVKLLRAAGNSEISPGLAQKFTADLSSQLTRLVSQEVAKSLSAVISRFEPDFVQQLIADSSAKLRDLEYRYATSAPTSMSAAFREAPCTVWPIAGSQDVPSHFAAAVNEVLVEGVDMFPQHFATHLSQATGAQGVREAARQIISGWEPLKIGTSLKNVAGWDWQPTSLGSHMMVNRQRDWEPAELTSVTGRTSGSLRVDLRFTEQSILANARIWVNLPGNAFKLFERQGILEWLQPETPLSSQEAQNRIDTMSAQFDLAVKKARPLVEIDDTLAGTVHGFNKVGVNYDFSTIPLNGDHPVIQNLIAAWPAGAGMEVARSRLLSSCAVTPNLGEIVIMGTTRGWYQPMCFPSLTRPIRDQWSEALKDGSAGGFWKWRRARSLRDFVPFSKFHTQAFLQGWVIGRITGVIRLEPVDDGSGSMRVVVVDVAKNVEHSFDVSQLTGARLGVKSETPGRDESNWNIPAALLEHYPLAMSKCQNTDLSPLDPYRAVLEIGAGIKSAAVGPNDVGGHNADTASLLDRWYANVAFAGYSSQITAASAGEGPTRVAATKAWLSQVIARMQALESLKLTPESLDSLNREYEIAPEIAAACRLVSIELSRDDLGLAQYEAPSSPITMVPVESPELVALPEAEG